MLRLVARLPEGRVCASCWRKEPSARRPCTGCGRVEVPYHFGVCAACACPEVLRELLTVDAHLHPAARRILDVLAATRSPDVLLGSAARPGPRRMLRLVAHRPEDLSHGLLDALPAGRNTERLRASLVAAGALAARDEQLALLESWLRTHITTVASVAERAALTRYVTWHLLAPLRRRSARTPVTFAQAQAARAATTRCLALLDWLAGRNRALATATQHDIDDWLAEGPNHYLARAFLRWAVKNRHAHRVEIPIVEHHLTREILPDTEQRWALARHLLHDDTVDLRDRVA